MYGTYKKIEDIVEKVNKKENKEFTKTFIKLVKENNTLKEEYINKFNDEFFKIKNKRTSNKKLIKTTLSYNIKFPKAFKSCAIEEVYNTDVTSEDKLLVKYNMMNAIILKDIIKGEFQKEYLVEFSVSLLDKKSKLERVLKLINNESVKEKINLLIKYKQFTDKTKNEIYNLMRQGYKIAVILDEKDNLDEQQIKRLDVFSYIVINEDTKRWENIASVKEIAKKVVKI